MNSPTPALPNHIRMRIARAIERGARFDASEKRFGYALTATDDDGIAKHVFLASSFERFHQAIMCILEFRENGTAAERARQRKRSEDLSFYRRQRKAQGEARKATKVERLRRKFYGSAA